jgi:DNA-binding CsgD family transcriptional regulator
MLDAARAAQIGGALSQADMLLTRTQPMVEDAREAADVLRLRAGLRTDLGSPAGAVAMMLESAEALAHFDCAAARDVLLEALHMSLIADPLGGPVTAVDLAHAIQTGPRPEGGGSELTELVLKGFALRLTGDVVGAVPKLKAVADALRLGQEPDDRRLWPWFGFAAALEVWDDQAGGDILERMARDQRAQGALSPLRLTLLARGTTLIAAGRLVDAEACYDEAAELTIAVGLDPALFHRLNGELLAWQGKSEEARATVRIAMEIALAAGYDVYEYIGMQAIAAIELSAGNYDAVRLAVQPSYDHDSVTFGNWALPQLIEAATRLGDRDAAGAALERLSVRAIATGGSWGLGLLARSRALVADDDHAEPHYRDAITLLGRTSMRPDLARAHLLYGEWLRRRKRRVDAREQLRIAHDMFSGMGAAGFAERARLELAATGEHAPLSATRPRFDLTPQEARIARLAAQRATTREIAAELFISPNTVDYHLRKVFQKVGVNSRRALSAALPETDVRSSR